VELAIGLHLEQPRRIIEAVERPLGRDLPLRAAARPAVLAAADHLPVISHLREAVALRRRTVGEVRDDR
jgi:hypothetical protein